MSTLVVVTLHHPPWVNKKVHLDRTLDYLMNATDTIKAASPHTDLILCGDFNHLPTKMLTSSHPDIWKTVKLTLHNVVLVYRMTTVVVHHVRAILLSLHFGDNMNQESAQFQSVLTCRAAA